MDYIKTKNIRKDKVLEFSKYTRAQILQKEGFKTAFVDFFDMIDHSDKRQDLVNVIKERIGIE